MTSLGLRRGSETAAARGLTWVVVVVCSGLATIGGVAAAVVAARHAAVTTSSPLEAAGGWRTVWAAGVGAAFVAYVAGVGALRRAAPPLRVVVAIAIAVQVAPLATPLLLSKDAYAYWDYARIGVVHDGNPYRDHPADFPADPAFRLVGDDWRQKPTVYGPVFTAASELPAATVGSSADRATLAYRALAAAAMVALALAAALAAARPAFAAAFVGWNPLLALHFAGGGHNDSLMAALMVGAIAVGRRGRAGVEASLWILAAAVKVVPLVFLPLRLLAHDGRSRRSAAAGIVVAAAAVSALAFPLYGYRWLEILTPVGNQLRATSSLGLPHWLHEQGVPERTAMVALGVAFVAAYVLLLREAWRGRARLALAATVLVVTTSWLQPWYAVWAVPLAAVEDDRLAAVVGVALTAYLLRDAIPI